MAWLCFSEELLAKKIPRGSLVPSQSLPFFTAFTGSDESPLSESGYWIDHANGWKKVRRVGNVARPVSQSSAEDDAYALLNTAKFPGGIPNNVEVICTLDLGSGTTQEHEILLRAADTATQATAYEFLYNAADGSVQIVKWLGPLSQGVGVSFTPITSSSSSPGAGSTGNQIRATAVGTALTFYWRANSGNSWTQIATATDSAYASGSCGIGFYATAAGSGNINALGFTDFQLTAL